MMSRKDLVDSIATEASEAAMSQPETARELIGKARSYRCSDQPCRCPACELARRVERALALHREAHGDCSLCWETWPCATRRALDWLE